MHEIAKAVTKTASPLHNWVQTIPFDDPYPMGQSGASRLVALCNRISDIEAAGRTGDPGSSKAKK
jgi:hypothetical protein